MDTNQTVSCTTLTGSCRFLITLLICLVVRGGTDGPIYSAAQANNAELSADLEHLDSLASSRDLHAIEVTIDKQSAKWKERERSSYLAYMSKACSLVSSYNIGDMSDRASMLSRYAISALTSGDLTTEERVQFTEFLMFDPPTIKEEDWKPLREHKAALWLEARRGVMASIDPGFDIEDRPMLNVAAPLGSGVPSGSSPESIRDPKLRAEYEAAIAANFAKARRYNEQSWLKSNAPRFYEETERYLVNAYSRPPADLAGLERLLAKYVDDNGDRARIVAAVRKGTQ